MKKTFVLVDYENVHPESVEFLIPEVFNLVVFVGASQKAIRTELSMSIQELGSRAKYVRSAVGGKNALDFYIAFELGKLCATECSAAFYILSKDTGFDPLISSLKKDGHSVSRIESVDDIPAIKSAINAQVADLARIVIERLKLPKATQPRTRKSLTTWIQSQPLGSGKAVDPSYVIDFLIKRGLIEIPESGKVSYRLADSKSI